MYILGVIYSCINFITNISDYNANIDNSTWFFIFMHLSMNGNWVCKLPFFVHGDDVRRLLLPLAICLCLRLCSLLCILVFKSKTESLFSPVTVSSNSLRWQTFNGCTWNCSFRILVVCYELEMWRYFFLITGLRSAERATSSLCGEQSGVKKCCRIMV